ncbi:mitotic apparatus protein p62-like [Macrobrachium nipponense]|uniref:mitotic apparatus protein p62-like n=1 Tax=Macrobrachium nipponense TaxID=159736 RepID=UPI0030C872E4
MKQLAVSSARLPCGVGTGTLPPKYSVLGAPGVRIQVRSPVSGPTVVAHRTVSVLSTLVKARNGYCLGAKIDVAVLWDKASVSGVKLDSSNKEIKWDGTTTENEEDCTVCAHTLSIRQAVLGPEASDDNVVEIETTGFDNKKIRMPVCVMKAGGPHVITFEVLLEDQQATFHLVQGSGPIYLSGTTPEETTVKKKAKK